MIGRLDGTDSSSEVHPEIEVSSLLEHSREVRALIVSRVLRKAFETWNYPNPGPDNWVTRETYLEPGPLPQLPSNAAAGRWKDITGDTIRAVEWQV
jgi:hypothetical protein